MTTMGDRKGDDAKRPPECTGRTAPYKSSSSCPNLKETGGGFEGEQYNCEVCGERYYLDYDDMR